jgi:dTDP-4-amino-4,6-dideoxygalactose transaminase
LPEFREHYVKSREAVISRIALALSSPKLSNSQLVVQLEDAIAARTKAKHCVAVSSATLGLMLAVRALTDGRSGDVLVPGFAHNATVLAPLWAGRRIVCLPVNPANFNLCVEAVAHTLANRSVAAIMAIGVAGNPSGLRAVEECARSAKVPLIVDAAPCLGATAVLGEVTIFSMSARKILPAGEGGLVVVSDELLAAQLKDLRLYGSKNGFFCYQQGLNARLSELHAAVALGCLAELDEVLAKRRRFANSLRLALSAVPGVSLQSVDDDVEPAWNDVIVRVPSTHRTELITGLQQVGVDAVPFYDPPIHTHPAFADRCVPDFQGREQQLLSLCAETIGLPVLSSFSDPHIDTIASVFYRILSP